MARSILPILTLLALAGLSLPTVGADEACQDIVVDEQGTLDWALMGIPFWSAPATATRFTDIETVGDVCVAFGKSCHSVAVDGSSLTVHIFMGTATYEASFLGVKDYNEGPARCDDRFEATDGTVHVAFTPN